MALSFAMKTLLKPGNVLFLHRANSYYMVLKVSEYPVNTGNAMRWCALLKRVKSDGPGQYEFTNVRGYSMHNNSKVFEVDTLADYRWKYEAPVLDHLEDRELYWNHMTGKMEELYE